MDLEQQQTHKVPNAIWGQNIEFHSEQGANLLTTQFIPLQQQVLDFLRNNKPVKITNLQCTKVYQILFENKTDYESEFKQFFNENVEGFVQEQSELPDLKDPKQQSETIVDKWLKIKKFLFWVGFFFKFCVEIKKKYEMEGQAFHNYVKKHFIEKNYDDILQCILILIDQQRSQNEETNNNIEIMIEIFLIAGIEKLVIKKIQGNHKDPLQYSDNEQEIIKQNNYYLEKFENPYCDHLLQVYSNFQAEWQQQNDTNIYIENALTMLEKEDKLLEKYCELSKNNLIKQIEQKIIVDCDKDLIENPNSGFKRMIIHKNYTQIENIYKFCIRIKPGQLKKESEQEDKSKYPINHLADVIEQYIIEQGNKININKEVNEKAVSYYQELISFKAEIDKIIKNHMDNNITLNEAKDKGFKAVLCAFENSGNFLAQFTDHYLHKDSCRQLTEDQIESYIDNSINFVSYLSSKDIFIALYEKYLCNRLLQNKVSNFDHENKVIACFKQAHSTQSMKNCVGMIQDIQGTSQINTDFQNYLENGKYALPLKDFKVQILQKSSWSIKQDEQNSQIKIPDYLQKNLDTFTQYFEKNSQNKKLEWLLQEGECHIQMQFATKCTLVGSTHQILFLLAFNEKDSWKIKELRDHLNFHPQKIAQFSKQFNKLKLVKITPTLQKDSKLTPDHEITLNLNFKSDKRRIILNTVRKVEDRQVEQISETDININRGIILEATIVKIMKGKRSMKHQELQAEVLKMVKLFKPEIRLIKKKIEELIERDYLERNSNNNQIIDYKP